MQQCSFDRNIVQFYGEAIPIHNTVFLMPSAPAFLNHAQC